MKCFIDSTFVLQYIYLRVSTLYVCVLDNTHQLTDIWKFTLNLSIHLLVSQNMKHKYEQTLDV